MSKRALRAGHHVVIVGGGFGGLYAARRLGGAPVEVTLVDRRNFHLFQPLLYQVATGGLSPGDIASPLRAVLRKHRNIGVLQAEARDIDPQQRRLLLAEGEVSYDTLVLATGSQHHYFGNEAWAPLAPGLKTVEDALAIRRRILTAFERAEREEDFEQRRKWLRFVVVGGGPTGVELAGALAELSYNTLRGEFRRFDAREVEIFLLEAADRVLPPFLPALSTRAEKSLRGLGVDVRKGAMVKEIEQGKIVYEQGGERRAVEARTVLWGAGMKASPLGRVLASRTGAELDRTGRVKVEPDLSVRGYSEILVLGDLAHFAHGRQAPLPGVAPVAMQQGRYVAALIRARLKGRESKSFCYRGKGNLAVIGRHAAVAQMGSLKVWGWPAWAIWLFVHIAYLIEYDNKVLVLVQWAWNYFTRKRGARLITDPKHETGAGEG